MEKTYEVTDVHGTSTGIDVFDLAEIFTHGEESVGNPKNPVHSTIITDIAQDNQHLEIHLDAHFVEMIDLVQPLTVKLIDSKKQKATLDGAEVGFAKALLVGIEFQYEGNLFYQEHRIGLSKNTNAKIFASYPIPNPALFSDTIIVQYNKETNEVTLQTTGSAVPSIITIVDVKGVF